VEVKKPEAADGADASVALVEARRVRVSQVVRHGFPMGRLGTAEEVADVIVFVASAAQVRPEVTTAPAGWSLSS
jgi:NAD(P)-dependent dehydrogenase (short-subunit alcohol dehydrogenase family)